MFIISLKPCHAVGLLHDVHDESRTYDMVCVVFLFVVFIWYALPVVQYVDIRGPSFLRDGRDSDSEALHHVCAVATRSGKRLEFATVQFLQRLALVAYIAGASRPTVSQTQVDNLQIVQPRGLLTVMLLLPLYRGDRPCPIPRSEAVHPRVCSFEATFERAREVAFDAAVT